MVKRQTIALLAAEEEVPLVLTAAAGAGGRGSEQDATSGTQSVSPVGKPRAKARAGSGSR